MTRGAEAVADTALGKRKVGLVAGDRQTTSLMVTSNNYQCARVSISVVHRYSYSLCEVASLVQHATDIVAVALAVDL